MSDERCPVCKGKGRVRSGQWGGFWDTCIRCGGSGKKPSEPTGPNIGVIIAIILIILAWVMYAFDLK